MITELIADLCQEYERNYINQFGSYNTYSRTDYIIFSINILINMKTTKLESVYMLVIFACDRSVGVEDKLLE